MASGKKIFIVTAIAAVFLLICTVTAVADFSRSADSTYQINYVVDVDCGTNSPENPVTYTSGSSPLSDAVPNEGYRFAGWYVITSSWFSSSYTKITDFNQIRFSGEVLDVYAFWYYTVDAIYNLNGGTLESQPAVRMTDEVTDVGLPVKEGRTLVQWTYDLQPSDKSSIRVNNSMTQAANSGTVTYTATWNYMITYVLEDDVTNPNPDQYRPGYSVVLKDPHREGFLFLGWYDESDNKVTRVEGGDCTLTAKWMERPRSYITYDLDGGTLIGDSRDWYYEGESVDLPRAQKDGCYFNGWMIDGEKSGRIESISSEQTGDLQLTPWWIDVEEVKGHGYVLDYRMTASQGVYSKTYEEKHTTRYYEFDPERGFFVVRTGTDNSTSSYWTEESESEYEFTYLGMQNHTLGGKDYLCEVYLADYSTYYEKQYIYDGWIPVSIEFKFRNGWVTYQGSYTLSEFIDFDITGTFEVRGYGDAGILVTGSGSYTIGTEAVLQAEVDSGTTFRGWFNGSGTLLSDETTYSFTVYTDIDVYAYNDTDVDYTAIYGKPFQLPHVPGMSDISWSVYNSSTGETKEYSGETSLEFRNGGSNFVTYSGILDGKTVYGFYIIVSDGYAVKSFNWSSGGKSYSLDLEILYSDFTKYRNDTISRSMINTQNTLKFVTSDDRYVVQIAKYIMTQTYGMNDTDRMNVLLGFVDYIEYKYDSESMGREEYFKYPLETLYDQNGDCEDTAILFCAVASAMGYRSALLLFEGHMAASVDITDGSVTTRNPATFVRDGVTYYYCETTTTGWQVGKAPTGYTYGGTYYKYEDEQAIMPVPSNYRLSDIDFTGSEAVIDKAGLNAANEAKNGLVLKSDDVAVDLSA
ncbi:MAG: InlB B-repeat-containing protein, partial [archaeon]|nr:InlB B-repeat-containing protein [archaeon]